MLFAFLGFLSNSLVAQNPTCGAVVSASATCITGIGSDSVEFSWTIIVNQNCVPTRMELQIESSGPPAYCQPNVDNIYRIDLGTDPNGTTYELTESEVGTLCFRWRIRPLCDCGTSSWSDWSDFDFNDC